MKQVIWLWSAFVWKAVLSFTAPSKTSLGRVRKISLRKQNQPWKQLKAGGGDDNSFQEREKKWLERLASNVPKIQKTLEKLDDENQEDLKICKELLDESEELFVEISELRSDYYSQQRLEGLTDNEFVDAIGLFIRLPYASRLGFVEALKMSGDSTGIARDFSRAPEIVGRMFDQQNELTSEKLKDALVIAKEKITNMEVSTSKAADISSQSSSNPFKPPKNLFGQKDEEESEGEDAVSKESLPRVTRAADRAATKDDLKTLTSILNNKLFVVNGIVPVGGGYLLRGENRKNSTAALLEAIDEKSPLSWDCQVCFLPDFTSEGIEFGYLNPDPVLLLLKKDMSPTTSPFALGIASSLAVFTTLLFCFGVYESNELVTQQLSESDIGGLKFFNEKLFEVLFPIAVIQSFHELSQLGTAKIRGIKTGFPVLFPSWGLPLLGPLTRLKESPRNLSSLFDYAFVGPVVGLLASLSFLLLGLQATGTAPTEVSQYFPSLSVSTIRMSTAGSALLDEFFGGSGSVSLQDPQTLIALHPWVIAGYVGLVINALELLPVGATDGGRIALSLFGRIGTRLIGSFVWLVFLLSTLFGAEVDALLGAWLFLSISHNDLEIPVRDEVEELGVVRATSAFVGWFTMLLIITPLS